MYSIQFPKMLSSARTILVKDHDATLTNLELLLLSSKDTLFGDPYFGTNIIRLLHSPNDVVLKDIIIDDIYTNILTFMPQVKLERSNIRIEITDTQVVAKITCTNLLDFTTNMYEINLLQEEDKR